MDVAKRFQAKEKKPGEWRVYDTAMQLWTTDTFPTEEQAKAAARRREGGLPRKRKGKNTINKKSPKDKG